LPGGCAALAAIGDTEVKGGVNRLFWWIIIMLVPAALYTLSEFDSLGIGIHTQIVSTQKAPFEGPITFHIGDRETGSVCSIGRNVADHVFVESAP
jgi:Fe2+ transport system protein FeoA